MGSGKVLKHAIKKHGKENFIKEILHVFDNKEDMINKEKELVVVTEDTYNLCNGGLGGFGYINERDPLKSLYVKKGRMVTNSRYKEKLSEWGRKGGHASFLKHGIPKNFILKRIDGFLGKRHSLETKIKMSETKKGKRCGKENSQYGTCWITNGFLNKKIKKGIDNIPEGWYQGRVGTFTRISKL